MLVPLFQVRIGQRQGDSGNASCLVPQLVVRVLPRMTEGPQARQSPRDDEQRRANAMRPTLARARRPTQPS